MRRPLVLPLLAVLLLSACDWLAGGGEIDGAWVLESGTIDGAPLGLPDDARVTLSIDGAQIGGIAACNHYGGELDRDGGVVSIRIGAVTEMGCEEPRMTLESLYLMALGDVETASRSGDQLALRGPGVELVFRAVEPVPDADLLGTRWILDSLVTGEAVAGVAAEEKGFLVLGEDGTMTGSTGCRSISGRFELDGPWLQFTDLAADMRGCEGVLDDVDRHVIGVLEGRPTVSLDGDRLALDIGETAVVYRAADE